MNFIKGALIMYIEITYNNGMIIKQNIHFITVGNNRLHFKSRLNPAPISAGFSEIPLDTIATFAVYPGDTEYTVIREDI